MSIHSQIRFTVKDSALQEVKSLIEGYASYVAKYAREHDEEWTWTTYQAVETPTDFVSVISHADESAEGRHRSTDETEAFADNLYKHVIDGDEIAFTCVASSEA